jgi:hypothetical protein
MMEGMGEDEGFDGDVFGRGGWKGGRKKGESSSVPQGKYLLQQ